MKIGLVGLEEDFEIAKRIFLYAYDCVMSYIKREIKKDPTDPPGTYREKCNAYGWGFVQGVNAAFEKQDEENREWGLVLVVPQAVDDSMKDMGKASTFGRIHDNHISYRAKGYKDGTEFDPSTKLGGQAARESLEAGA